MARKFLSSNSDYLVSSGNLTALNGVSKFTLACWVWVDSYSNSDQIAMELSANYNNNTGAFLFDIDEATGDSGFLTQSSNGSFHNRVLWTRLSAAAWHHYVIGIDLNITITHLWLDGVDSSTDVGGSPPGGNFNSYPLYFMSRAGSTLFLSGRLQEVAIWPGINLTQAAAQALFRGASPLNVFPSYLAYYWPIVPETPVETNWGFSGWNYAAIHGTQPTPPAPVPLRRRPASPRTWATPTGTNWTRLQSDNIGVSDSVLRLAQSLRLQSDNLGLNDSVARIAQSLRLQSDNAGLSDSVLRLVQSLRLQLDNLALSDSQLALKQTLRLVADSLGITDQAARAGLIYRLLADNLGLSDAIQITQPPRRRIAAGWGAVPGRRLRIGG
jgi:hypothetical protein